MVSNQFMGQIWAEFPPLGNGNSIDRMGTNFWKKWTEFPPVLYTRFHNIRWSQNIFGQTWTAFPPVYNSNFENLMVSNQFMGGTMGRVSPAWEHKLSRSNGDKFFREKLTEFPPAFYAIQNIRWSKTFLGKIGQHFLLFITPILKMKWSPANLWAEIWAEFAPPLGNINLVDRMGTSFFKKNWQFTTSDGQKHFWAKLGSISSCL